MHIYPLPPPPPLPHTHTHATDLKEPQRIELALPSTIDDVKVNGLPSETNLITIEINEDHFSAMRNKADVISTLLFIKHQDRAPAVYHLFRVSNAYYRQAAQLVLPAAGSFSRGKAFFNGAFGYARREKITPQAHAEIRAFETGAELRNF
jgi:hypothetical protein